MRVPTTMRDVSSSHHGAGQPAGAQGTLGGVAKTVVGSRPGRMQLAIGDEGYLWILVALEVLAIAWLRSAFRRHHGG